MRTVFIGIAILFLYGCMGMPKNVTPIDDFELNRYLGKWYEIARLDHSFERGLSNVSANYTLREDGGINVTNRGYSATDDDWRMAEGKAYFVQGGKIGYLKVSFFGPFYSSYVIFELDKADYNHAYVSGYSHSYLWLLSRTPTVDEDLKSRFIENAGSRGFDTNKLIFVTQGSVE